MIGKHRTALIKLMPFLLGGYIGLMVVLQGNYLKLAIFAAVAGIVLFIIQKNIKLVPVAIITLPLFYKLKISEGVYLHPTVIILFLIWTGIFINSVFKKGSNEFVLEYIRKNTLVKLISIFLMILMAASLYGVFNSGIMDKGVFLRVFLYIIAFSIFPLALQYGKAINDIKMKKIVNSFIITSVIFSLISFYWMIFVGLKEGTYFTEYNFTKRVMGTFGQYLDFSGLHLIPAGATANAGEYLVIITAMILVLLLSKERTKKTLLFAGMLINVTAIALTYSSISYVCLILIVYIIFKNKMNLKGRVNFIVLAVIIIVSFLSLLPSTSSLYREISETNIVMRDGKIVFGSAISSRAEFWIDCLKISFSNAVYPFIGIGFIDLAVKYKIVPHSLLFGWFTRVGIFGCLVLFAIWHRMFKQAKQLFVDSPSDSIKQVVSLGLFAFLFGWLISNLFSGEDFLALELIVTFWGLLGLITGMSEAGRQEKDTRAETTDE